MARASNEFALAWHALANGAGSNGWQTIQVTAAGGCPVAAGRCFPDGQEALLIGFPGASVPSGEKLPDGGGFSVLRVDPYQDGIVWLALTRKAAGTTDLFSAMACDVVSVLDDATNSKQLPPYRQFLTRVRAWQEFMRKAQEPLSPEAELGLVGELHVLRSIVNCGVDAATAVESWKGPLDASQDFQLGVGALEVKSTLSTVGFPARIGTLEQLDDAVLQPLFVAGLRFHLAEDGFSLPDAVGAVAQLLRHDREGQRCYEERLMAAGYLALQADRYSRRFSSTDMRVLLVDVSFPRLVLGRVPQGVIKAAYEIDLDKVSGQHIDLAQAMKQLGVI
jgi:Putative  PD-(D/E)XK family member, (DUF4420)